MAVLTLLLLLAAQPDSARLVSRARNAQAAFESARLVLIRSGASDADPCRARIGRFCYHYSGAGGDPPPEPKPVAKERAKLLVVLDTVARAVPADAWVAGQRVRYWLEAGHTDSAAAAARECRAAAWWCAALRGLARHEAGDFAGAERAFRAALDSMPNEERCRWSDLSDLLEGSLRDRFRGLGCGGWEAMEARIWWLAQPLWSLPGNDRRTEHYARLTMATILEDARWGLGSWGDDARELIVRYGWPVAWEKEDCSGGCTPIPLGYLHEPSYHFLPGPLAYEAGSAGDPRVALNDLDALERYAPAYADTFTALHPDFTSFRRGDSTIVVATYDVSADTLFRDSALTAALVLARDERSEPVVIRDSGASRSGVLEAEAPWQPDAVSLELLAPAHRAAGRARASVAAGGIGPGVAPSGIILFDPADSLPRSLAEALARAHAGPVRAGSRIGLYWEVYGLLAAVDLATTVTVTAEGVGWLRRVAAAVGLAPRSGRVGLEWHEAARPRDGIAPRAVVLDLAALRPGRYRVAITVSTSGAGSTAVSRTLTIVRP